MNFRKRSNGGTAPLPPYANVLSQGVSMSQKCLMKRLGALVLLFKMSASGRVTTDALIKATSRGVGEGGKVQRLVSSAIMCLRAQRLKQRFGVRRSDSQQRPCWALRLAPPLLPILKCRNAHADEERKLGLGQLQTLSNRANVGWCELEPPRRH